MTQDFITTMRRESISKHLEESRMVLEFGPYIRPTILASDKKDYFVIDCFSQDELKQYAQSNDEDNGNIPVTNFLIDPLSNTIRPDLIGKFDLIIANHVFEHLIDPFRWLHEWEKSLIPGGKMILCIPDKKQSFDKFRSDTSFSHLLSDFFLGGQTSLPEHLIDCALLYSSNSMDTEVELKRRLSKEFLEKALDSYQPGLHVHVFQYEYFIDTILKPFLLLGHTDLDLVDSGLLESIGEFYVVLSKSKPSWDSVSSERFFHRSADSHDG